MSCAIKFVKYDKEGNEIDTVAFFTSSCVTKLPQEKETLNLTIDQAYYKMFVVLSRIPKRRFWMGY